MLIIRLEYSSCFWNGQVEADALICFNRTAMLTHDPFEIRFGRSSCSIRHKRLVHQRLNKESQQSKFVAVLSSGQRIAMEGRQLTNDTMARTLLLRTTLLLEHSYYERHYFSNTTRTNDTTARTLLLLRRHYCSNTTPTNDTTALI